MLFWSKGRCRGISTQWEVVSSINTWNRRRYRQAMSVQHAKGGCQCNLSIQRFGINFLSSHFGECSGKFLCWWDMNYCPGPVDFCQVTDRQTQHDCTLIFHGEINCMPLYSKKHPFFSGNPWSSEGIEKDFLLVGTEVPGFRPKPGKKSIKSLTACLSR